ncbi:hypothetical protein FB451DRAFT_1405330 [Mycena latifolia]|nr:hypothetical protein FB451DRAFT_1405330 [Mycena latifolia]
MVGRSLFLPPTTFPPAVLGEVSSSKLQATSQALKPQASSLQSSSLPLPASSSPVSPGPLLLGSRLASLAPVLAPSRIFRCLRGLPALRRSWPNTSTSRAALDVAGAHKGKGGNAAINGITQLTGRGTSYWSSSITPKAVAASTADVPDGFKILHARLAEAAAAAAAPATDDA